MTYDLSYIIAGVDFSPRSIAAVHMGHLIAGHYDAELLLVHAMESIPTEDQAEDLGIPLPRLQEALENEAGSELEIIAESVEYKKKSLKIIPGKASDVLSDLCRKHTPSLLAVGDIGQRSGEAGRLLGSTTHRLLREADCDILVTRPLRGDSIRRVMAAVCLEDDDSLCDGETILNRAKGIALVDDAKIDIINVVSTYFTTRLWRAVGNEAYISDAVNRVKKDSSDRLDSLLSRVDWGGMKVTPHVLVGSPASELIKFARSRRVDVTVLGVSRLPNFALYFVGGTAQQVVEHTPSSVMVVRPINQL